MNAPHHDGSPRYVSDPAPDLGSTVDVWVRVPHGCDVRAVYARTTPDGEPRFWPAVPDRRTATDTWWRVGVEVRNPVTRYRFLLDRPGGYDWLTAAGVVGYDVPDDTDFRLVAGGAPPAWAADAVVYEIFPDRFARSTGLPGRAAEAGPAAQNGPATVNGRVAETGAAAVPDWVIPCDWDAPVVGRGPETSRQWYGGDLDGIVQRLDHIRALGVNTVYLTPIFPARSTHRYDATTFDAVDPLLGGDAALRRLADALHGNGMRLIGDLTTNHTGDTHEWFPDPDLYYLDGAGGYESWLGVPTLPKLNWSSESLRRRFFDGPGSVTARWLTLLDGWRVDVANMTGRLAGHDQAHEVARLMRRAVAAARSDGLLVAEHAHDASADLDTGGWHGTMNYAGFTRPLWTWLRGPDLDLPDFLGVPGPVPCRSGIEVVRTMREFAARVSWSARTHSWNLLGSHDTARFGTVAGSPGRVEVGVGLLATLPGTPMVFAGDEFGLPGAYGEDSRRPMPWGRAVLPAYPRLLGLRRDHPALRHGGLRWTHAGADVLAFWRETAGESLLVLARRAAGEPVALPAGGTNVYGGAGADPGDGPTFQVWSYPPG